jgi:hypothetical protein
VTAEDVAATLLAFVADSGAESATAVVDAGTVDVDADGSASLERPGSPIAEPLDPSVGEPLDLGTEVRRLPAFDVDAASGEVRAPFGALDHLASGLRALAATLGGRSVALVRFPTLDGETPFALAAREGEALVVVIGDEQFEMAPEWPTAPGPG